MPVKHTIRDGNGVDKEVVLTRGAAIHAFCVECMGYQIYEVAKCTSEKCPLYPYRMGRVDSKFD